MQVQALSYQGNIVAYRMLFDERATYYDIPLEYLDETMLEYMAERVYRIVPLREVDGLLYTDEELSGSSLIRYVDCTQSLLGVQLLLTKFNEISGTVLYTNNGVALVVHSFTRAKDALGNRYTVTFVIANESGFNSLVEKGLLEGEDRPQSYPATLFGSVSDDLYESVKFDYFNVSIATNQVPLYDINTEDGYTRMVGYRANQKTNITYTLLDNHLGLSVEDLVEQAVILNVDTI